jgi:hypothetical protein
MKDLAGLNCAVLTIDLAKWFATEIERSNLVQCAQNDLVKQSQARTVLLADVVHVSVLAQSVQVCLGRLRVMAHARLSLGTPPRQRRPPERESPRRRVHLSKQEEGRWLSLREWSGAQVLSRSAGAIVES